MQQRWFLCVQLLCLMKSYHSLSRVHVKKCTCQYFPLFFLLSRQLENILLFLNKLMLTATSLEVSTAEIRTDGTNHEKS